MAVSGYPWKMFDSSRKAETGVAGLEPALLHGAFQIHTLRLTKL